MDFGLDAREKVQGAAMGFGNFKRQTQPQTIAFDSAVVRSVTPEKSLKKS